MLMTGAEIIIKVLQSQEIKTIAGIPGGAALPIYDALSRQDSIQHILARHEQGAGFIAQGMARSTGKPAVCLSSSGPGATNLVTAIADAKMDSIPIVCITAQVPNNLIGTDAFQEIDTYGISIPITKYNYLVRDVSELTTILLDAFSLAQTGRPGPVWVDIPKDVLMASVDARIVLSTIENYIPCQTMLQQRLTPDEITEKMILASQWIKAAKKPVLYLGGGIIHADAAFEALQLAEKAHLPTTMTLMGLGAIPSAHPLSIGMLGMHGARYTNLILHESDLLVVVGARFDDRAVGKVAEFCPNAKIIHIDIDAAEIDKIKTAHLAIELDAKQALQLLTLKVEAQSRDAWLEEVNSLKNTYPLITDAIDSPLSHYGLISHCAQYAEPGAFITTDVGQHQMWVAQTYPFEAPRQWLTSGGLGTMGFGMPAAIGAALAHRDKQVICFTGDGSIMMNIQELATLAEHQLNVKVILLNNRALGMVHQQQTLFYEEEIYASTYQDKTNFIKIAEGFGIDTCDLNKENDPKEALKQKLLAKGPCLIHVMIDLHEKVYPVVVPGAANIHMINH